MVVIETFGEYLTRNWYKITPHGFPDRRVVNGNISLKKIKLKSTIMWVIGI